MKKSLAEETTFLLRDIVLFFETPSVLLSLGENSMRQIQSMKRSCFRCSILGHMIHRVFDTLFCPWILSSSVNLVLVLPPSDCCSTAWRSSFFFFSAYQSGTVISLLLCLSLDSCRATHVQRHHCQRAHCVEFTFAVLARALLLCLLLGDCCHRLCLDSATVYEVSWMCHPSQHLHHFPELFFNRQLCRFSCSSSLLLPTVRPGPHRNPPSSEVWVMSNNASMNRAGGSHQHKKTETFDTATVCFGPR